MSFVSMLGKPSAFFPVAMSSASFATVVVHVALFGAAREADEGTAAHVFQILMAAQLPVIAFFAFRWLPKSPGAAIRVLALQFSAALVALAPVFLLGL
jgi:hypothetical protein